MPSGQEPPRESIEHKEGTEATTGPVESTVGIPRDIRNMAMLCHLAALAVFTSIPFANILGPLIVWLMKREDSTFIDTHGKEAVNFQISITIYAVISVILIFVIIGLVLLPVLIVFFIITLISASIQANNGYDYRYPLSFRFIK